MHIFLILKMSQRYLKNNKVHGRWHLLSNAVFYLFTAYRSHRTNSCMLLLRIKVIGFFLFVCFPIDILLYKMIHGWKECTWIRYNFYWQLWNLITDSLHAFRLNFWNNNSSYLDGILNELHLPILYFGNKQLNLMQKRTHSF